MTEHDKADQARKGLIDSVKGKAKELAGAVTGNDSLTAEGQLEQTQAQERKQANSIDTVADAEAEQARTEAADARLDAAHQRGAVNSATAAVESSAAAQQAIHTATAEQAAQREAEHKMAQAKLEAKHEVQQADAQERVDLRAADGEVTDAVDDHEIAVHEADRIQTEADEARQRADSLTNHADLP